MVMTSRFSSCIWFVISDVEMNFTKPGITGYFGCCFFSDRDNLHAHYFFHPLTDAGHVKSAEDIFEEYLFRVTAFEEKTGSCKKGNNLLGTKSNGKLQFPLAKSYSDVHAASVNSSRQLLQRPGFSWSMHEGRPVEISSHYTQAKSRNSGCRHNRELLFKRPATHSTWSKWRF